MKKLLLGMLLTLATTSCMMEQGFLHYFNEFTVEAGDHRFKEDNASPIYIKPILKFSGSSTVGAYFTESAFYDKALLGYDSMDVNKLYGLSDCYAQHQSHSVRVGWRPIDSGVMELFAYVYSNGNRTIQTLGTVVPYERFKFKIDLHGDYYDVWFKGAHIKLPRDKKCNAGTYYRLFPYFGGNKPAPHKIQLWMHEEN